MQASALRWPPKRPLTIVTSEWVGADAIDATLLECLEQSLRRVSASKIRDGSKQINQHALLPGETITKKSFDLRNIYVSIFAQFQPNCLRILNTFHDYIVHWRLPHRSHGYWHSIKPPLRVR